MDLLNPASPIGLGIRRSWTFSTAYDIGPHLSCTEAEALAELFQQVDAAGLAKSIMEGHTESDEEGDDHYDPEWEL